MRESRPRQKKKQKYPKQNDVFDDKGAKYRAIFETTGTASIIIEEDTTISLMNREYERLSGYRKEEVEGKKSWTEFTLPEDLKRMKKYHCLRRTYSDAVPKTYESRFVDRKGDVKDVVVNFDIIPGTKQSVASYLDITSQKHALKRLEKILNGVIEVVASILEARDAYTASHQRRVTDLASAIAREMKLSKDQIEGLNMAGIIHDLGKISVPAEILSKPFDLTETEFSLIKNHPVVGYNILKTIEFPWPIADIVLQHHERMDGSGYPEGRTGGDILLEARILAVADIVEAMASHRPYRPALGIDKALEEIEQNKGTLYDHKVAHACLKLFKTNKFEFNA